MTHLRLSPEGTYYDRTAFITVVQSNLCIHYMLFRMSETLVRAGVVTRANGWYDMACTVAADRRRGRETLSLVAISQVDAGAGAPGPVAGLKAGQLQGELPAHGGVARVVVDTL